MPIANCLPTFAWQLGYQKLFPSECKGRADDWSTVLCPVRTLGLKPARGHIFRYINNYFGILRIDWKNYTNSGIMWHTCVKHQPHRMGISWKSECWIVILGGVHYIQILEKCIMILQSANASRPGQCRVEMRTFRIKVLCLLQTTLLQSYINHADRNQKHARRIPS